MAGKRVCMLFVCCTRGSWLSASGQRTIKVKERGESVTQEERGSSFRHEELAAASRHGYRDEDASHLPPRISPRGVTGGQKNGIFYSLFPLLPPFCQQLIFGRNLFLMRNSVHHHDRRVGCIMKDSPHFLVSYFHYYFLQVKRSSILVISA